jgi:hypothetical protein
MVEVGTAEEAAHPCRVQCSMFARIGTGDFAPFDFPVQVQISFKSIERRIDIRFSPTGDKGRAIK